MTAGEERECSFLPFPSVRPTFLSLESSTVGFKESLLTCFKILFQHSSSQNDGTKLWINCFV